MQGSPDNYYRTKVWFFGHNDFSPYRFQSAIEVWMYGSPKYDLITFPATSCYAESYALLSPSCQISV